MDHYITIRNEKNFTSTVKYNDEAPEISLVEDTLQGGLDIG